MKVRELGHVVLWVRDLPRSLHFYRDVLGFPLITDMSPRGAMFGTGRTHHELLLLQTHPNAAPIPEGPHVGMYHFALCIGKSDAELTEALQELEQQAVEVVGLSDHKVSHSIYLKDPDGNEVELYIDVQPETWREQPELVAAPTRPLHL